MGCKRGFERPSKLKRLRSTDGSGGPALVACREARLAPACGVGRKILVKADSRWLAPYHVPIEKDDGAARGVFYRAR